MAENGDNLISAHLNLGAPSELGYSHILAVQVCAAGKGMVFKPFTLG